MAFNPSSSRDITLWAQLQSGGPRIINNTSGTWTNASAAKLRFDTFGLTPQNPINTPQYKTGKRSPLVGVRGRQGGSWTLAKPIIPSGTAGTAPDDDPLFQAMFGQAATVVASTSVTYTLADAINFLTFLRYNKTPGLTNPTNAYVLGAVPTSVRFTGGGNFLQMDLQGSAVGVGDSQNFSSYATSGDAVLEGGLSAYPTEPGSATQNGNVIPGFGSGAGFSIDGSALAEVRNTIEISGSLGVDVIADGLDDAYPTAFIGGLRTFAISRIQALDSDGSVENTLKQSAFSKSAHTVTLVFGNVAGSIVTFTLSNVQFGSLSWQENGAALDISIDTSMAHAANTTSEPDLTLAFT